MVSVFGINGQPAPGQLDVFPVDEYDLGALPEHLEFQQLGVGAIAIFFVVGLILFRKSVAVK